MTFVIFILIFILGFLAYFIGGPIFALLGVGYESKIIVFKFFLIYSVINLPIELVINGLIKIITEFKNLDRKNNRILKTILEIPINIIVLLLLDKFVNGIELNYFSAFIFSLFVYLLDNDLDK